MVDWPIIVGGGAAAYMLFRKKPLKKSVEEATEEEIQEAAPARLGESVKLDVPTKAEVATVVEEQIKAAGAEPPARTADFMAMVIERRADVIRTLFEQYAREGWTLHEVPIPGTPSVVFYASPPGAIPPEWEALIERHEEMNACVPYGVELPGPVRKRLQEKGWSKAVAKAECLPGEECDRSAQPMLCPPGVEPAPVVGPPKKPFVPDVESPEMYPWYEKGQKIKLAVEPLV